MLLRHRWSAGGASTIRLPPGTVRAVLALLAVTSMVLLFSAADTGLAQCPEAPPYVLLPPSWTCPVIPTCGTQYGVCLWPRFAAPGQPCSCQAPDGASIPGVITRGSPGT